VAPIGFGDSFSGYPIVGTTTALIANAMSGFAEGGLFAAEGEAVIGAAVHLPLGAEIKPMHGTATAGGQTHGDIAYHVTGRLKPTGTAWDRAILVPIQAVWHLHGLGGKEHEDAAHPAEPGTGEGAHHDHGDAATALAGASTDADDHDHHTGIDADAPLDETWGDPVPGLPAVLVKPKTIADAYKLRQEYRVGTTLGIFPGEVLTNLYATLGDVKQILLVVASGAQGLVAASLMLVTVMHIGQRRRQIGALRAFGAPRLSVFAIVWLELVVLFAAGIGAGFALGYGAALLAAQAIAQQSGFMLPVEFMPADARLAALLALFAAVLAALPALLAYRQSPAAALRS
jgi:putative ABC transport system permease protein